MRLETVAGRARQWIEEMRVVVHQLGANATVTPIRQARDGREVAP